MATFVEELWNSVFTPGPTSTLLVATNATFFLLQALLGGLFLTTYSIHFAILSVLCGGLWYAINWFAEEIKEAQAREEEIKRRQGGNNQGNPDEIAETSMDSGADTETELDQPSSSLRGSAMKSQKGQTSSSGGPGVQASGLAPPASDEALRVRRSMADSSGDISTDSEWEKVEDES